MKICFLLPTHWSEVIGGAEIQVKYIMEALSRKTDVDMTYVCRHAAADDDAGVPIYTVKHSLLNRLARFVYGIDYFQIMRLLKRLAPDVIYTRIDSPYVGIAARYCKQAKCKLVWHIAHQRDVEPYRIRDRRSLVRYLDRKLFEHGVHNADVIIGQASYQDALLKKHFGRSCTDIIPNFHPEARLLEKPDHPVRVVWVASIKKAKRPEAFLSLADALRHHPDVELLMIGPIQDQSWNGKLEHRADELDNLTYLGELPVDEVNAILSTSHILVNTSESEGFPNTFIQAWLRKTVVVSLSIDPDGVLAREGYGCLSRSQEKLAEDVLYLAAHESEREAIAERSLRYALDTYSLKNADRLLTHLVN